MSKRVLILFCMIISVATLTEVSAQVATVPSPARTVALPADKATPITIPRFEQPPVIDGRLNDDVWKKAAVFKDFYQVQPGDNINPSQPTEVLIGYDSKYLYLAFHCYDEPDKIRATVAQRDNIFDDDYVGLYLDTFNDKRKAYEFLFNPFGVQADAIFTEGSGEDFSVDILMESKGTIGEDGYIVEAAIPFKSLRYKTAGEKIFGINFFRRIKRFNNELDSWVPLSRDNSSTLSQFGKITGFEGISKDRVIEIIPSFILSESGNRVAAFAPTMMANTFAPDAGHFVNSPAKFDPSLNVKIGFSPTKTLDITIKPDFAQVEADQTVVRVNQRFPIFFEEKRPFFLEGIDIFKTPLNAVNTRAIIAPLFAIKFTGKEGRETFGVLLAADSGPGNFTEQEQEDPNLLSQIEKFLDKKAYIAIVRFKHDLGTESNIGIIATSYSFIEKHNNLAGIDGRFRLDDKTVFSFQALGTTSRQFFFDPDLNENVYRTGNGLGYNFDLNYAARHLGVDISGEGRTLNYIADLGFTTRVNTNADNISVRYNSDPKPMAKLISWSIANTTGINFNDSARNQSCSTEVQLQLTLIGQTSITLGFNKGYERLFEEEFGPKRNASQPGAFFGAPERSTKNGSIFTFGNTAFSKKFTAAYGFGYSTGVFDFDFGAGPKFPRVSPAALMDANAPLDPGPGKSLGFNYSLSYKPNKIISLSLDYTKSRLTREDNSRLVFDDNIYSLKANYQFSSALSLRARVDYESLASRVTGQFLLAYAPSPGTAVYLGYNDDLNINGYNPFTMQKEPGFHRNSRTFFLKVSYLFRKR